MGFGFCEACGGYWCSAGGYVNHCVCPPPHPSGIKPISKVVVRETVAPVSTVTYTTVARIIKGEHVAVANETVTMRPLWVSPAYAYACGWRLYGRVLAARGWRR